MGKEKKIVIANSVGIDSNGWAIIHSPSRWTNSSKEKDVFTYYPWELAYTSSLLKRETDYCVKLIDGCLEKLNGEQFFERLSAEQPTFLLMEPSTRTWEDDRRLMERVKKACGTQLIVAGQHAIAFPQEVSRIADYVLIGEYEFTVLDIVQGRRREDILGLYPNARRPLLDVNLLPWPEDNDVARIRYGLPGEPSSEYLEVQAYASRGCPLNCTFCVCRHLYYAKPNWRPRNPKDVIAELQYLRNKYPQMEGIFFDEECHNIGKKFILDLTGEIKAHKLHDLKIEAMCAYYTLDEEMLYAMKEAGYYLLRVGIETAGEGAARGIHLGTKFNLDKLRETLQLAKKVGIKMYGTFTFGAPGSSRKDDQATLDLMEEIIKEGLLWRFQTSICTPQPGTPFYAWAKEHSLLKTYSSQAYDGGNRVVLEYDHYSACDIMEMYLASQKYFDLALKNRFSAKIDGAIPSLRETGASKILVLRTSRMPQIELTLHALQSALPASTIDVLGQPSVGEELSALQHKNMINNIYLYEDGFFLLDRMNTELLEDINKQDYDLAVVVYNNTKGRGYGNVEELVAALHIKEWVALSSEGVILKQDDVKRIRNEERTVCGC